MKKIAGVVAVVSFVLLQMAPAFAQLEPPVTPPVTPPADTTPPVISAVVAVSVSSVAESITWVTDELAVSTFQYGTTTGYGSTASISASAAIGGTAALTGLAPATTYYYCITSTDTSNNTASSCGRSFTTAAAPDTTPPVIANISEASVSPYHQTIAWSTNELATSSIRYGTAANNLSLTLPVSASVALVHEATILSLASGTTYYYCIDATDLAGNTASSCGHSFATGIASSTPPPDTTPPTISLVTVAPIATSTVTVTWTTSEVANGQVEYGTSTAYGSSAGLDTDFSLTDEANLTGLAPSTTYHYRVRSSDQVGNVAYSNDNTFTTGALPVVTTSDTTPPIISNITTTSVSSVAATIIWSTNELAVSTMSYGTSLNYGSVATLPAGALLAHTATLVNLAPNTTYYYCIHANDLAQNGAATCGQSFTTAAAPLPPDTTPPVISGVAQGSVASYDVTIVWSTNELATSSIRYGMSTNYGSVLAIDASAGLVHSGTIADLSAATVYYYCIDATDLAGNTTSSCSHSFTTAVAPLVPDTTPPAISLIAATSLATSTATVTWTTNELANAEIEYGTSTSYGAISSLNATFALTHSESLSNLVPGETYHYRVMSADAAGNVATSPDNTFTTGSVQVVVPADTTPPAISAVVTGSLSNVAATITWTTNELATSTLVYGTTMSYGSAATIPAGALLVHEAPLINLAPQTTYYYCISATDLAGNTANSCGHSFTTGATPDTTPPVIANIIQASLTSYDATIAWTTNELATSSIHYGTSANNLSLTLPVNESAGLVHEATIASLSSNTIYYYCLYATDLAGNMASSCGHSLTTTAPPTVPDTIAPTFSAIVVASLATTTATVTWTTSEPATAQVAYGTTASYGSMSPLDSNLELTHSAALSGLAPNTTYHYQVRSVDIAGNVATSTDAIFTTEALPQIPTFTPNVSSTVNFSAVETESVGTSTVTISWNTDLPANGQIEYGTSEQLGSATPLNATLSTSHTATITGLAPNTNYIFRVASAPSGANEATPSANHEFNTLAMPTFTSTPANVSVIAEAGVTTSTANITWITDQSASAEVQYGISTEYGQSASSSGALATSHTIALSDLAPETMYHYRVKSVNGAGDITFSSDHTFMTVAPISLPVGGGGNGGGNSTTTSSTPSSTIVSAPSAISNLSIADYDPTSAMLTWNVSSANADAAAEYDIRYSTSPITQDNFANAAQDQVTAILYPDIAPNDTVRSYTVAGLQSNTTYYFAITSKYEASDWAAISNVVTATTEHAGQPEVVVENNSGNTSGGGSAGGVTFGGGGAGSGAGASGGAISGPIGTPTLTGSAGNDSEITLNWNNPNTNSFVRTIVVKKAGSYPASPTDGQVIYEGNGGTFTDTNVSNGTTYYYAIYSYDRAKNYSSGIRVSLAPQAGVSQTQINENPTITTGGPAYHFTQVYAQGDTDPEVAHLQEMLARYNVYPENRVTSYFGPLTEAALKRFQAMYGVPQTGIVDPQTQILLNAASLSDQTMNVPQALAVFEDGDLQLGDTSEDVGELQQFLIYEGDYPEAQVTGYFGMLTQKAVIAFQKKYGILPDVGYVGPITRHTIATISGF